MACKKELSWYELIPLLSFLAQRGRCRNCKTKISIQYPLVELATGLVFSALFFKLQNIFFLNMSVFSFTYAYYAIAFSLLLVIAVYDVRHKIVPDVLSLVLGVLAFIGLFLFSNHYFYPHVPSMLEFLAGPLIALPFYLFWLLSSGRWMGLGDAKLALGLGWLLGLSSALSGLVLAFWSGAMVGIVLIIFSKKYGMKTEIPFAPYLAFGAILAFIFELNLFNLYF